VIDQEQEWIAKYRAALGTTPIRPSRVEVLIAGMKGIFQELVSTIAQAFHNRTIVQVAVKASEAKPCQKVPQAVGSRPNLQRRAGTPNPRKRHPTGQPRRRRAS
jgi:hypothetical protein